MRIYVAGPYSGPTSDIVQVHVDHAMDVGRQLIFKGHNPFVPHYTHYMDHPEIDYDKWLDLDIEWLAQCEALFLIAPSPGACREVDIAIAMGLPIYHSLDEVPNA